MQNRFHFLFPLSFQSDGSLLVKLSPKSSQIGCLTVFSEPEARLPLGKNICSLDLPRFIVYIMFLRLNRNSFVHLSCVNTDIGGSIYCVLGVTWHFRVYENKEGYILVASNCI